MQVENRHMQGCQTDARKRACFSSVSGTVPLTKRLVGSPCGRRRALPSPQIWLS